MPVFGERSERNLAEAHPLLQKVLREAIKRTRQDFTVIEAFRPKAEQDDAYRRGTTKAKWPNSAHNHNPSAAIDVIPYPFKGWNDKDIHKELKAIATIILEVAKEMGVSMRWGGNWSSDPNAKGTGFVDSPHFELHPWRSYV